MSENAGSEKNTKNKFDITKVSKSDIDLVQVDHYGRVTISNLSIIDLASVTSRAFESDLSKRRFIAISKKSRIPFPRQDGINHVFSFTNLEIMLTLLKTLEFDSEFVKKVITDEVAQTIKNAISEAELMYNISLHKKHMYNEANSIGNVRIVESY